MVQSVHKRRSFLDGYLPIYLHSLRVDNVLDFDLYSFNGQEMVLFLANRFPFTRETLALLAKNNIRRLYISVDSRRQYQRHIQAHIAEILADPSVDGFTKSSIVYDSAVDVVRDVFESPGKGEAIKASQEFVESTVMYVLEGQNAFHNILRVMSFDYSVYTHSVNVSTFALALAHAVGIERTQELIEIGTGALLHDIGKVMIPEAILHKPGPLDESEWSTMRQHPRWGVEIISETDLIPEAAYMPIEQHHERRDGSGYPDGRCGEDIHIYGKIVAIADSFDAMTTNRVYRPAADSFSTLKELFDLKDRFDLRILEQFTRLMGPTTLGQL
jgi:putative nucleotidyltransferase with HDIG domain